VIKLSQMPFKLQAGFQPSGDQPQAIEQLLNNFAKGTKEQVLLGVTGSGKTFTIANLINKIQRTTLIISHNKTLAAQLYQEFKDFFPQNAVSYFVSYYDFYQPEAYIPQTDTYIEKSTDINEEIDKLRLATTANLMSRTDVIVVASVSAIYNLGRPEEYRNATIRLIREQEVENIKERLVDLQYARSDFDFKRGTFRAKGEYIDIYPSYDDFGIRYFLDGSKIQKLNTLTGQILEDLDEFVIYPAKHFIAGGANLEGIFAGIRKDKELRAGQLRGLGKEFEARRIESRVEYDLEMITEIGYVNGIENYSRYFDGRAPGDPPFSLLDYFPKDYLLVIDESHATIPQIRGMYNGDRARKQTLIDFGFRLPAALDNRPLKFDEFRRRQGQTVYVSATPNEFEKSLGPVVEQLVRPTGIVDPEIEIRPVKNQIPDLIYEIRKKIEEKKRVLVTTLTKRLAEEISEYIKDNTSFKAAYLHSDVETIERSKILKDLRKGVYDVLVGINLLREGLDLPEVGLVAILDADKEGFLRSEVSLVQTMGRGARNVNSLVLMYADKITGSMERAISEVSRRRNYQLKWNKKYNIEPRAIIKPIREDIAAFEEESSIEEVDVEGLTPEDKNKLKKLWERRMREAAKILDFEGAAKYRDKAREL